MGLYANRQAEGQVVCQHVQWATLLQLGYTWQHDTFHDWKLANGQQLSDGLARELREQVLRRIGVDPGIDNVRQAAERLCEAHSFDPVVDYLANVQPMWDGESRLDTWLTAYLGADDTPLNRAIGSRVLIAAVRRARAPSTKFDEITVFESEEGTSKSAAIAMLAGADNFSDQTILGKHMTDRDIQEKFKGIWLYEIADMTGMVKSEVEAVKAMASRITDRGRPAYGHFVVRQPRRCVLFATTNDDTYLRSQTGNRRFLPVKVAIIHSIDIDALSRDRDQLWAEAAAREAAGESILLPKELWGVARAAQEARLVEDPWDDVLRSVTGTLHDISGADGYRQEERITTNKLLLDYLRLPVEKCNDVTAKRLVHVMKRLGWERSKDPIRIGNEKLRGFRRPYPPPSDDPSQENTE